MAGLFLETMSLAIAALFPIMNPFSTAPLFVSLTADFDEQKRRRQALLGCSYAFGILILFLLMDRPSSISSASRSPESARLVG